MHLQCLQPSDTLVTIPNSFPTSFSPSPLASMTPMVLPWYSHIAPMANPWNPRHLQTQLIVQNNTILLNASYCHTVALCCGPEDCKCTCRLAELIHMIFHACFVALSSIYSEQKNCPRKGQISLVRQIAAQVTKLNP